MDQDPHKCSSADWVRRMFGGSREGVFFRGEVLDFSIVIYWSAFGGEAILRSTVVPVRGMASSDWYLFGVATAFAHKPRSAFGDDIVPSGEGLSSSLVLDIFRFSSFVLVPRVRRRANHSLSDFQFKISNLSRELSVAGRAYPQRVVYMRQVSADDWILNHR
jgi:hypothetical protein